MIGISPDLQRVWRRRGHIRSLEARWAKFDTFEVANLYVRHELAQRGYPPTDTRQLAERGGKLVVLAALLNTSGAFTVRASRSDEAEFRQAFDQSDLVASELAGTRSSDRYLWSGDGGPLQFSADLTPVTDQWSFASISAWDLWAMGTIMVKRAPRPLFMITVER